jgi:hypothetical protein
MTNSRSNRGASARYTLTFELDDHENCNGCYCRERLSPLQRAARSQIYSPNNLTHEARRVK